MQIKTTKTAEEFRCAFPYNPDVIAEMRSRGGKWDASAKEWVFKGGSINNGELAIDSLFGSSDETVTIRIGKENDGREYMSNATAAERGLEPPRPGCSPDSCGFTNVPGKAKAGFSGYQYLTIGGYLLASRRGRDYGADIVETLVSGTIPRSGGSVKNPAVAESDECMFELEVRRDFAERLGLMNSATGESTEESPLAEYSVDALLAELGRRGVSVVTA